MANIYMDSAAPSGGSGSELSPFNSLEQLNSVTAASNVYFKRGSVFYGALRCSMDFTSASGGITWGAYGEGPDPVIINESSTSPSHQILKAYNLTLRGLDFREPRPVYSSTSGRVSLLITLAQVQEQSNLLVEDVSFSSDGFYGESSGFALKIQPNQNDAHRYSNVKVRKCRFSNLNNGVQILGSSYQVSAASGDWATDNFRSYNVRVESCKFRNVKSNSVLLCFVDSVTTDKNAAGYSYTSGIFNCTQRGASWGNSAASVPFWVWQSWRTVIDYCVVGDMYGENSDHQAYDIDVGCSYCVIRRSLAYNCSGGFALVIGEYKQKADRLGATPADPNAFFMTQHGANGYNVIEDCVSYNCGVGTEIYNANDQSVVTFTGVQHNTTLRRLLVIDTRSPRIVSTNRWGVTNDVPYTPIASIVKFNDGYYATLVQSIGNLCTWYDSLIWYKNAVQGRRVFYNYANNNGRCPITLDYLCMYSVSAGTGDAIKPTASTTNKIQITSVLTQDPKLLGTQYDSPKTLLEASRITLGPSSPVTSSRVMPQLL